MVAIAFSPRRFTVTKHCGNKGERSCLRRSRPSVAQFNGDRWQATEKATLPLLEGPSEPKVVCRDFTHTGYDVANQLTYGLAAAGRTTYTFDAAGNQQIELTPAGARTTTTWNYENQPTVYQLSTGSRVTMSYNADNRRTQKQTAATTSTKFIWEPTMDAYFSELNNSNTNQKLYTFEPVQYGNLISQRVGGDHYIHADALGSTRALSSTGTTVSDTFLYDAWGNEVARTGTTAIAPFRWVGGVGYYYDTETGMYYVRARMYKPTLARWMSVDPLHGTTIIDAFAYSWNSPVLNVDARGLAPTITRTSGIQINVRNHMGLCSSGSERRCGCKEIHFDIQFAMNAPKLPENGTLLVIVQRIRFTVQYARCQETCVCSEEGRGGSCQTDVFEYLGIMPQTDGHSGIGKSRENVCENNCAYKEKVVGDVRVYELAKEPSAKMTTIARCNDCYVDKGYRAINGNGKQPDFWTKKPLLWALYAYTYQTSCCDDPPKNKIGYTLTMNNLQILNIPPDGTIDVNFPEE
jgi:RHS repeat-associated protein